MRYVREAVQSSCTVRKNRCAAPTTLSSTLIWIFRAYWKYATRLENLFKGLEQKLDSMTDKLARMKPDLNEAIVAKGKPF